MASVILDPSILWLMEPDDPNPESLGSYISDALDWLDVERRHNFDILLSMRSIEKIATLGLYPAEPHFETILNRAGLNHVVSPQQLGIIVTRFIASFGFADEKLMIEDIVCSDVSLDPAVTDRIANATLRKISDETGCLVLANNAVDNFCLWGFLQAEAEKLEIVVDCNVEMASGPAEERLPNGRLTSSIIALSESDKYLTAVNSSRTWALARSSEQIGLSIKAEAIQKFDVLSSELIAFTVGERFIKSLEDNMASGTGEFASIVLRKCAEIIGRQATANFSDFHNEANRSSGVRTRRSDGATAKRCHVTETGRALRLMFWCKPNGDVDFANIGNKWEEIIYE